MSQSDFGTIDTASTDGVDLAALLESFRDALHSLHAGSAPPSYAVLGLMWLDTSAAPYKIKINDGTDNIVIGEMDPATNSFKMYYGAALAGTLAGKNAVGSAEITDGAITEGKLGAGAVTSGKIALDAVDATHIKTTDAANIRGELGLGSAALKNTGTGAGDVPLNANLGALAGKNTVASADIDANAVGSSQLASTTVVPGSYTSANVTIDSDGRITTASNGTGGLTSISQGNLNTSLGSVSDSINGTQNQAGYSYASGGVVLPGGQYGFCPQIKRVSESYGTVGGIFRTSGTSFVTAIAAYIASSSNTAPSGSISAQQRYVTASPPIDLGEGEAAGFAFMWYRGAECLGHYLADVPPWLYNGPTCVRSDVIDHTTGQKYRRKRRNVTAHLLQTQKPLLTPQNPLGFEEQVKNALDRSLQNVIPKMRAELGKDQFQEQATRFRQQEEARIQQNILSTDYEEITQEIKNADMDLIPHPFLNALPTDTVVLVGLYDPRIRNLIEAQNNGEDIMPHFASGAFYPGTTFKTGIAPPGVQLVDLKIKSTK